METIANLHGLAALAGAAEDRTAADLLVRRDLIALATGTPQHRLTVVVPQWMFMGQSDLVGSPLWHTDVAEPMIAVPYR